MRRLGRNFKQRQPGNVKVKTLAQQVAAILRKNQSTTHAWLPGIGTVNGLIAGNYIDSTGNTPCALNDVTGLVLDANGTVGTDVVTNGDFSIGTGWDISAGTIAISGGKLNITAAASGAFIRQLTKLTSGKTYEVTYTIDSMSAGGVAFYDTVVNDTTRTAAGTYTSRFKASGTALGFICIGASSTAVIDNLSVKEVTGIHATQATTANKPQLSKRYNLLTKTEDFSAAVWQSSVYAVTIAQNITVSPIGDMSADGLISSASSVVASASYDTGVSPTTPFSATTPYTHSISLKKGAVDWVSVNTFHSGAYRSRYINLAIGSLGSGDLTCSIASEANGFYRVTFNKPADSNLVFYFTAATSDGGTGYKGNGVDVDFYLWGASVVPTSQASLPYQRVNTATDYDTVGFPYKFDMQDATDLLTATFPAGYESATVIDVVPSGQVTSLAQNIVGTYNINTDTNGRFVFRDALSAGDLAIMQSYANKLVGL